YTAETWLQIQPGRADADPATVHHLQQTQAQTLKGPAVLTAVLHQPDVAAIAAVRGPRDPLDWLDRILTVASERPGTIRIHADGEDPAEITLTLRAVVHTYLQEQNNHRQTSVQHLQAVHARGEQQLREKQALLASLDNPRLPAAEKDLQQARFDLKKAQV